MEREAPAWELFQASPDARTLRLRIVGGWLYRVDLFAGASALTFVPVADDANRRGGAGAMALSAEDVGSLMAEGIALTERRIEKLVAALTDRVARLERRLPKDAAQRAHAELKELDG